MEDQILDSNLPFDREINLVKASKGKRFANFIIDYIMALIVMVVLYAILYIFDALNLDEDTVLDRLVGILVYVVYYLALENGLDGKTIGKFITGTRTVNMDGSIADAGTIFKRSLSRLVPFEPFSFLGSSSEGWHDKWTDTIVIDEKLSQE